LLELIRYQSNYLFDVKLILPIRVPPDERKEGRADDLEDFAGRGGTVAGIKCSDEAMEMASAHPDLRSDELAQLQLRVARRADEISRARVRVGGRGFGLESWQQAEIEIWRPLGVEPVRVTFTPFRGRD
jgi:hypothetical protein